MDMHGHAALQVQPCTQTWGFAILVVGSWPCQCIELGVTSSAPAEISKDKAETKVRLRTAGHSEVLASFFMCRGGTANLQASQSRILKAGLGLSMMTLSKSESTRKAPCWLL